MTNLDELLDRQHALQADATALLADLDIAGTVADLGPVLLAGSYVSGLMSWPDLDVMVHVGPDFAPRDVLRLLERFVDRPGVIGFDYGDERGRRSPTEAARDERYHVVITVDRGGTVWRIDLTLWLNDPHANVTAYHETLRDTVTEEQRGAILRLKDVWCRRPDYPDDVGGFDIYQAVLEHDVRTPEQFDEWLNGSRSSPR